MVKPTRCESVIVHSLLTSLVSQPSNAEVQQAVSRFRA
jgi:hypothetical protein